MKQTTGIAAGAVGKTLPLVLFALFFALASFRTANAQEPLVTSIEIRGLRNIEEGAVKRRISQEAGIPLSAEKITEDIKNIYESGWFEDVRVEAEPFEGGLKLIYIVQEKPSIMRVEFSGNEEMDDSKLREQITVATASIADVVLINDNAIKLKNFYEQEGYGLAEVVPVLHIRDAGATLTFLINEGPRVKVGKLNIDGNKALSDRKIRKVMKTTERGLFSFITKGGYYKRSEALADVNRIRELYYNNGYLQAVVSEPEVEIAKDRMRATLTYRVSEGEQFRVSKTEFEGNKVFKTEDLQKLLTTKPGQPVSREKIRADVISLTEKHTEKGYATASVSPEIIPDIGKKEASVLYHVEEGDIYRIGRIEISGNVKTRDYVIRREILLNEGDTFNSKLLKRSYQKINNLNFFESVSLKPEPVPQPKLVNLAIEVEERPTGFLSVGGGYSSVDRLIGMIDLTQGNLGGRGQYVKAKAELGGRSSFYEFSFREPWLFGRKLSLTTSLYNHRREYIAYERKATGFELGLGKPLNEYWGVSAAYKIERATIFDVLDTASDAVKEQEGTKVTSSISPSITRDTRDNYLDPHTGSKNTAYLTFAGLGGDNKFLKFQVDSSWFLPLGPTTFALRGRYGHATGIFGETLPLYERFYVGGIYTIRGLGYGEGGPRDESGEPIGGERQVILNVDYIFPIISALKLKGVAFFDMGSAYDDSPDLRYTTGLGVRWISPMGPVRIEWGYNLDRKPDEKSSRWEFAFGTFF